MMKTLLFITALMATVNVGTSLKCFVCAGSETSDCAKGKSSAMVAIECKSPNANYGHRTYPKQQDSSSSSSSSEEDEERKFQIACVKLVETDYKPHAYVRGCAVLPKKSDPCQFIENILHVTNCKSCTTDYCNAGMEHNEEDAFLTNFV